MIFAATGTILWIMNIVTLNVIHCGRYKMRCRQGCPYPEPIRLSTQVSYLVVWQVLTHFSAVRWAFSTATKCQLIAGLHYVFWSKEKGLLWSKSFTLSRGFSIKPIIPFTLSAKSGVPNPRAGDHSTDYVVPGFIKIQSHITPGHGAKAFGERRG